MGTSKRYPHVVDRDASDRIAEVIMRSGLPETLTPTELQLDVEPLTKPPQARPVRAWVRYPDAPLEVKGIAVAWTARAVAVKWQAPDGEEHRAWVWASAVESA